MNESQFAYSRLTLDELRSMAASPQVGTIQAMPQSFRALADRVGEVADLLTHVQADLPNWWKGTAANQAAATLGRAAAEARQFHESAIGAATAVGRCAQVVAEQQNQMLNVPELPEPGITAVVPRPTTPFEALEAARQDAAYQAAHEQAVQVVNGIAAQYVETRSQLREIGILSTQNFAPTGGAPVSPVTNAAAGYSHEKFSTEHDGTGNLHLNNPLHTSGSPDMQNRDIIAYARDRTPTTPRLSNYTSTEPGLTDHTSTESGAEISRATIQYPTAQHVTNPTFPEKPPYDPVQNDPTSSQNRPPATPIDDYHATSNSNSPIPWTSVTAAPANRRDDAQINRLNYESAGERATSRSEVNPIGKVSAGAAKSTNRAALNKRNSVNALEPDPGIPPNEGPPSPPPHIPHTITNQTGRAMKIAESFPRTSGPALRIECVKNETLDPTISKNERAHGFPIHWRHLRMALSARSGPGSASRLRILGVHKHCYRFNGQPMGASLPSSRQDLANNQGLRH